MEGKDGWIDVLYGRVCKVWLGSCDASMKTSLGFRREEKISGGRRLPGGEIDGTVVTNEANERLTY